MWSFAGFIFLQIVQVIAAPIPGEATGFLGGFLYGPFLGILLNTIGLTIGSVIAFQLSRTFGRPAVDRLVDPKTMSRFDFLLHHKGGFLVFLLFLLPGFPKDYLCYILGLGHLSLFEFTVIGATGRLLGTMMLTFGGSFLRQEKYMELSLLAGGGGGHRFPGPACTRTPWSAGSGISTSVTGKHDPAGPRGMDSWYRVRMSKDDLANLEGTVIEARGGGTFVVRLENGQSADRQARGGHEAVPYPRHRRGPGHRRCFPL